MATLSPETRKTKLDELYEFGKSKGTLTYKEIMDRLMEMEMDPDQLDKVNREFFVFASEQGLAYEKITCGGSYRHIRDEMADRVNDKGWSKSDKYQKLSTFEKKLLMGFINESVLTSYRQWVEGGKEVSLEEVIEMTNRIVLGGVNGFFE